MTDRQALLSAAGKQRPYKAVNIKPPAMPGDIYFMPEKIFKNKVKKSEKVFDFLTLSAIIGYRNKQVSE